MEQSPSDIQPLEGASADGPASIDTSTPADDATTTDSQAPAERAVSADPVSILEPLDRRSPEQRLAELAERASDILKKWSDAGDRHERAVHQLETQLTEFEAANARLQRDASQKMQDLERAVHGEWTALREVHEEPIRQLREQANSLTEVCIATAHSAQRGFEQAEARLVAIEMDLQQRIADLRREVHAAVGEVRNAPALARVNPNPPSWPLDGVTRLHQQIRQSGEPTVADLPSEMPDAADGAAGPVDTAAAVDPTPSPALHAVTPSTPDILASPIASEPAVTAAGSTNIVTPPDASVPTVLPAVATSAALAKKVETSASPSAPKATVVAVPSELVERVRTLEKAIDERQSSPTVVAELERRSAQLSRVAIAAIVAAVLFAGGFALWIQGRVQSRLAAAQQQSQAAADAATQQAVATREQAARDIAAARDLARQAQIMSAVLAAPDLVRYPLGATGENAMGSAQALWSRTRGFVLSGSRLGQLPNGAVYQVWLITRGQAISAGTFTPDASGTATLAIAPPTTSPVIGVVISEEPAGGSPRPLGRPLLVRYPPQS